MAAGLSEGGICRESDMCRTCFENFIRFGGTKTFVLNLNNHPAFEVKQDILTREDVVRQWVDDVWNRSFGATTQAILKTKPFEFSAAGLSDLDMDALRADSVRAVLDAMEREGFDLSSDDGQQRALAVLFGHLNQAQQAAMGIEFYVWNTQHDARVREGHAERHGKIFRWDDPPEGGYPSQDFGCRCYARALGIEGYWERIKPSVDAFAFEADTLEGSVDHMYLDTEDNVTVGIGTLLATSDAAAALAFRRRDTDALATEGEVRAEFDLIDGMLGSRERGAEYYRDFTSLYLAQGEINGLVIEHMRSDFDNLVGMFPYFGDFPLPAQIALWDMIYNLGPRGLQRGFPLMRQAIQNGDWQEAARQSHRQDISEERNEVVFDLFMQAAEDP
jgi:GH24 family phage-related lysozyme (muramidase)